jgi:1,4-dihydroxy-2-naphthoate octaprenyltransferase
MERTAIKHWVSAMRLRTLPLTVACIALGAFIAQANGFFQWPVFVLCLITALLLQILSNLANDYGDAQHGADHERREGPVREVQAGNISAEAMFKGIIIFSLLSLASGISLLLVSGISLQVFVVFVALGILSISAAILYTNGKRPYGYIGLGDIAVFVFFGIIGVLGSYYLQAKALDWSVLLPASSCGLLTVAVLNVNNIRDIESDIEAGKLSIPVRLGRKAAIYYHLSLLSFAVILSVLYILLNYRHPGQFIFLIAIPLLVKNAHGVIFKKRADELDPYLKQMSISTLVFVFLLGLSIII